MHRDEHIRDLDKPEATGLRRQTVEHLVFPGDEPVDSFFSPILCRLGKPRFKEGFELKARADRKSIGAVQNSDIGGNRGSR